MENRSRAVVVAAFGVGPLLLASGCGGTSAGGARATIANIQPTTYAEIPPVTTTTTTTLPTDFQAPEGSRSPVEQVYTIQAGDFFSKIADMYDITVEQLVNYNKFPDGVDQLILPGQQILIPPDALVPGTASEPEVAEGEGETGGGTTGGSTETPTGDGCVHTIAEGEFPNRVARQYGITTEELFAANPGGVMETFLIGAQLQIPANGDCS